jgi:hypothetical protein
VHLGLYIKCQVLEVNVFLLHFGTSEIGINWVKKVRELKPIECESHVEYNRSTYQD